MTEAPNIVPGQPLSPEQKAALGKFNEEQSIAAEKQAAEQIERDRAEGRGTPTVATIADSLKKKLEAGEILPPEAGTTSHTHLE